MAQIWDFLSSDRTIVISGAVYGFFTAYQLNVKTLKSPFESIFLGSMCSSFTSFCALVASSLVHKELKPIIPITLALATCYIVIKNPE